MRSRTLRLGLCAIALLLLGACAGPESREPAPKFTVTTLAGETLTRESLKGKVVLMQFWTTWCGYCRGEQPMVDALNKEFSGKGLVVLAVDVGESRQTVQQYLDRSPRSCRIALNEDSNLAESFDVTGFPVYVAIDRDGNIAGMQRGAGGEQSLRNLLSRAGLESE